MFQHAIFRCGHTDYYVCCRDGKYKQARKTDSRRSHQRQLDATCISRMYVNEFSDDRIEVKYIAAHHGHELGVCELPHLPLPQSVKESVAIKLNQGIPPERILDGS